MQVGRGRRRCCGGGRCLCGDRCGGRGGGGRGGGGGRRRGGGRGGIVAASGSESAYGQQHHGDGKVTAGHRGLLGRAVDPKLVGRPARRSARGPFPVRGSRRSRCLCRPPR
ncbi:MAG: hypothetical protein FJW79_04050 [Actinobacteria bacterium]|nr:hypothetical protein [Actinomycetota bacterium]